MNLGHFQWQPRDSRLYIFKELKNTLAREKLLYLKRISVSPILSTCFVAVKKKNVTRYCGCLIEIKLNGYFVFSLGQLQLVYRPLRV